MTQERSLWTGIPFSGQTALRARHHKTPKNGKISSSPPHKKKTRDRSFKTERFSSGLKSENYSFVSAAAAEQAATR